MKKESGPNIDAAWENISTPKREGKIIGGMVSLFIKLGITPDQAGDIILSDGISNYTRETLAQSFGEVGDPKLITRLGEKLKQDPTKK